MDGLLAVSRSLGDFWVPGGIDSEPDVRKYQIPDESIGLVLACDGLWDFVEPGIVANLVRNVTNPVKVAKVIQDFAYAAGSHDNITVIVYNFVKYNASENIYILS